MIRAAVAVFFAIAPDLLFAGCLRPVDYLEPRSDLELSQSYRLASETLIYPGFNQLVISPTNRDRLYTLQKGRYEPLAANWPEKRSWEYRKFAVRPDGTIWGFGGNERGIYTLSPGGPDFIQQDVGTYTSATYDAHRDVLLLMNRERGLLDWDGVSLKKSELSGLPEGRKIVMPRYIVELTAWLALVDGAVLIRFDRSDAGWVALDTGGLTLGLWQLGYVPVHLDREQDLLVIVLGGSVLVYHVQSGVTPRFLYRQDFVTSKLFPKDGHALVGVKYPKKQPGWIASILGAKHVPESVDNMVVTPQGLLPVSSIPVRKTARIGAYSEASILTPSPYRSKIYHEAPLMEIDGDTYFFDGFHRIATPQLNPEQIGQFARWFRWKERIFVVTKSGWFELMPDLYLRAIPWPLPPLNSVFDVHVGPSETFNGLMVVHQKQSGPKTETGAIWTTQDGEQFEQISDGEVSATRYISDVPNEDYGLVLGKGGLYLLSSECSKEATK